MEHAERDHDPADQDTANPVEDAASGGAQEDAARAGGSTDPLADAADDEDAGSS